VVVGGGNERKGPKRDSGTYSWGGWGVQERRGAEGEAGEGGRRSRWREEEKEKEGGGEEARRVGAGGGLDREVAGRF